MLDGLGIETGVSLEAMLDASRFIEPLVGHALPSRVLQGRTASHVRASRSEAWQPTRSGISPRLSLIHSSSRSSLQQLMTRSAGMPAIRACAIE